MSARLARQAEHATSSSHEFDIELGPGGHEGGPPATVDHSSINAPTSEIPRATLKLLSAGFSFFVAGTNDGSIGALIPYMIKSYNIGTSLIAVLYMPLSPIP
jgi:fucose permease